MSPLPLHPLNFSPLFPTPLYPLTIAFFPLSERLGFCAFFYPPPMVFSTLDVWRTTVPFAPTFCRFFFCFAVSSSRPPRLFLTPAIQHYVMFISRCLDRSEVFIHESSGLTTPHPPRRPPLKRAISLTCKPKNRAPRYLRPTALTHGDNANSRLIKSENLSPRSAVLLRHSKCAPSRRKSRSRTFFLKVTLTTFSTRISFSPFLTLCYAPDVSSFRPKCVGLSS